MFDKKNRFMIDNYTTRTTFSSFLPGISGKLGIPIWCFYVNRGQAVAAFGVEDKDHSIMEFFPAHQAYQFTKTVGFRTFLKIDGAYYEPFQAVHESHRMFIGKNELEIEERNQTIKTNVLYYTLPNEKIGGLVRKVTITNVDTVAHQVEMLDGMPAIIPYGVSLSSIKEMGQTCKAWMQVEDVSSKLPYYKVRASMGDTVDVHEIKGGHFYFAMTEAGDTLPVIVDPMVVFSYDSALSKAVGFEQCQLDQLFTKHQVTENNLPCGFFGQTICLEPGQSTTIYQVAGLANSKEELKELSLKCLGANYFEQKYKEAVELTEELCSGIRTKTASPTFDAYCEQTYLDNLLRGGYPIKLGEKKVFYLYSRKHGDMERDYNFFSMLPEFYSQGNANFRDVNQNRRCDVLFSPYVQEQNIKTFYNLIQMDGYNPLAVQKETFYLEDDCVSQLEEWVKADKKEHFKQFIKKEFTPGSLLAFARDTLKLEQVQLESFLVQVIDLSQGGITAEFGEGFWTDHWTYNLDQLETYFSIYPEQEEKLLFQDKSFTYYQSGVVVNPRKARYVETDRGIRQYKPLNEDGKNLNTSRQLRCENGRGDIYKSTLMEKLILLCSTKFATLDAFGMGIEMEAGKPGWYDALNGLPGIFGSSMAETYELSRLLNYVKDVLVRYPQDMWIAVELKEFIVGLDAAVPAKWNGIESWNKINDVKEEYRDKIALGINGAVGNIGAKQLQSIIEHFIAIVDNGIRKALDYGKGISPTYFSNEVVSYEKQQEHIIPTEFKATVLPHFLEGPVRYLKLPVSQEEKRRLYRMVKSSNLYDNALSMYKINESLADTSFEVGRTKAFTPGWLENESIWLHMEYKYLLELLKSNLYEEYFEDFYKCLIPFQKEEIYGRSILENSSFIASSANPNKDIHGKGFVARLSGSTAEFVHMWQIMMFGGQPFKWVDNELVLTLEPTIPEYLIPDNKQIECTFLGKIKVIYQFNQKRDYYPGNYKVVEYEIQELDGLQSTIKGANIPEKVARKVRNEEIMQIKVYIK